uniref:Uncharacterized protein n=1 Tax=Arundo donax TaxID=35708 RepID=A0A0A8YRE0_ARUDO
MKDQINYYPIVDKHGSINPPLLDPAKAGNMIGYHFQLSSIPSSKSHKGSYVFSQKNITPF